METAYGHCHCGCGEKTNIVLKGCPKKDQIYGKPYKYIFGHHLKLLTREKANHWKGGRSETHGYVRIYAPENISSNSIGYVREHIFIAEKVLEKKLPKNAVVHHVDANRSNNINSNLVVCENEAYHRMLHQRTNALKNCGHAGWRKCQYCKTYDSIENLYISPNKKLVCHKGCAKNKELQRIRKPKTKLK